MSRKKRREIFDSVLQIVDDQPMSQICVWFGYQMGQIMKIDADIEVLQAQKARLLGQIEIFRDEMKKGGAKI